MLGRCHLCGAAAVIDGRIDEGVVGRRGDDECRFQLESFVCNRGYIRLARPQHIVYIGSPPWLHGAAYEKVENQQWTRLWHGGGGRTKAGSSGV